MAAADGGPTGFRVSPVCIVCRSVTSHSEGPRRPSNSSEARRRLCDNCFVLMGVIPSVSELFFELSCGFAVHRECFCRITKNN